MKTSVSIEKEKLQQLIDLLKFALSLEDAELLQTSVESVIENLEELKQ